MYVIYLYLSYTYCSLSLFGIQCTCFLFAISYGSHTREGSIHRLKSCMNGWRHIFLEVMVTHTQRPQALRQTGKTAFYRTLRNGRAGKQRRIGGDIFFMSSCFNWITVCVLWIMLKSICHALFTRNDTRMTWWQSDRHMCGISSIMVRIVVTMSTWKL